MSARKAALEDASHQAGWMFADLLLALMVIFLAAQSFVPKEASLPQFEGLLSNKTSLNGTATPLVFARLLTSAITRGWGMSFHPAIPRQ